MELETIYVDGGHLCVSSTTVEFYDTKSPVPTQYSDLWPNFYLKDSANKKYGFLVHSVAP